MDDHHWIASVTQTLAKRIEMAARPRFPEVRISTERPNADEPNDQPRINIFLFNAAPNPGLRNLDLPTRDESGRVVSIPRLGVDLDYLVTFYGAEGLLKLQPQQLAAITLAELHANPMLEPSDFADIVEGRQAAKHVTLGFDHPVAVTLAQIEIERLSRLWSVAFQAPYALTVAYKASAVLLQVAGSTPPAPALPVVTRNFDIFPRGQVRVEDAWSVAGRGVAVFGQVLHISGAGLSRPDIAVTLNGVGLEIAPGGSDSTIEVTLDDPTIAAGAGLLRVQQGGMDAAAPLALLVRPAARNFQQAAGGGAVSAEIAPPPQPGQSCGLALAAADATGAGGIFPATVGAAVDGAWHSVSATPTGLKTGTYYAALEIDGVASLPEMSAEGDLTGPMVTMTEATG